MLKRLSGCLLILSFPVLAYGQTAVGKVDMLEVWQNGNVAFTLTPLPPQDEYYCNGQYILNASATGTKNQLATVLLAKATGKTIRVVTRGCGPADNYGANYIIPVYIYLWSD